MPTLPTKNATASVAKRNYEDAADSANETVARIRDGISDVASTAGKQVREFLDNRQDDFKHQAERYSNVVSEKPIQSTLIALGVGFVLAKLLRL